jgi:hypothetical protein
LLGNSFAVFGEDFSGVFVEGLFAAPAADVVVLAFVADLDRAAVKEVNVGLDRSVGRVIVPIVVIGETPDVRSRK